MRLEDELSPKGGQLKEIRVTPQELAYFVNEQPGVRHIKFSATIHIKLCYSCGHTETYERHEHDYTTIPTLDDIKGARLDTFVTGKYDSGLRQIYINGSGLVYRIICMGYDFELTCKYGGE